MHVLVTGGTGFFGKALLRHWRGAAEVAGARFTLLSRDPAAFQARHGALLQGLQVDFHQGDVQRPDSLPRAGGFTHLLHAATDSTGGLALTPMQRFDQIVDGTRHVLRMAERLDIPRVLMTSSGGVYGAPPAGIERLPETFHGMPDPLQAQNAYSVAKRAAEHLCALQHDTSGLDVVIARCFAFVGEDLPLDKHFAIGNFIGDALAGREIVVQGDGSPLRSYLDQRDLAHWLTALLLRGAPQRAYNVGSDEALSIAELAHMVARVAGESGSRPTAVRVVGAAVSGQSAQRNRYVPDIARARDELGLDVTIPLEAAIRHTLARHLAAGAC